MKKLKEILYGLTESESDLGLEKSLPELKISRNLAIHKDLVEDLQESTPSVVTSAVATAVKGLGFSAADPSSLPDSNKIAAMYGLKMRAGKWADTWVGKYKTGQYFVQIDKDLKKFKTDKELIKYLKGISKTESRTFMDDMFESMNTTLDSFMLDEDYMDESDLDDLIESLESEIESEYFGEEEDVLLSELDDLIESLGSEIDTLLDEEFNDLLEELQTEFDTSLEEDVEFDALLEELEAELIDVSLEEDVELGELLEELEAELIEASNPDDAKLEAAAKKHKMKKVKTILFPKAEGEKVELLYAYEGKMIGANGDLKIFVGRLASGDYFIHIGGETGVSNDIDTLIASMKDLLPF